MEYRPYEIPSVWNTVRIHQIWNIKPTYFCSFGFCKSLSRTFLRSSSTYFRLSHEEKLTSTNVSWTSESLISRSSFESVVKLGEWFTWKKIDERKDIFFMRIYSHVKNPTISGNTSKRIRISPELVSKVIFTTESLRLISKTRARQSNNNQKSFKTENQKQFFSTVKLWLNS